MTQLLVRMPKWVTPKQFMDAQRELGMWDLVDTKDRSPQGATEEYLFALPHVLKAMGFKGLALGDGQIWEFEDRNNGQS